LEVPTIYKAYIRPKFQGISPQKMARNMVQYLHFRILEFPLTWVHPQQPLLLPRSRRWPRLGRSRAALGSSRPRHSWDRTWWNFREAREDQWFC
jgi:hypothetical protein